MSVIIKICGLSTPATLDTALDAGAEMIGVVFFPPSPRHVDFDRARALGRQAAGRALKIALAVDPDDQLVNDIVASFAPDILQLHGHESVARLRDIKKAHGLPIMKAMALETAADLAPLAEYTAVADRILFDARPPKDATRPGGLGASFDWALLRDLALDVPFMVSGGLDSGNVGEAIRTTRAHGVDVSSGVETTPGIKDADKIRAFVRAARQAG